MHTRGNKTRVLSLILQEALKDTCVRFTFAHIFLTVCSQHNLNGLTFIPHGSDVVEPLLDRGYAVRRVLVPPPRDLGDGCHGALQGAARLGNHGVVTQVEVQSLNYVGRVVIRA